MGKLDQKALATDKSHDTSGIYTIKYSWNGTKTSPASKSLHEMTRKMSCVEKSFLVLVRHNPKINMVFEVTMKTMTTMYTMIKAVPFEPLVISAFNSSVHCGMRW